MPTTDAETWTSPKPRFFVTDLQEPEIVIDPKATEKCERVSWHIFDKPIYECRAILCPEKTGFSVYVANLPGVASQGETVDEAKNNIREAFLGAIETYVSQGKPIPWSHMPSTDLPKDAKEVRILVNG